MRALLDVNVLVALFDQDHVFNDRTHRWLEQNAEFGIATCPLTENGLIRILSHPGYSKSIKLPPSDVVRRLENFISAQSHSFWSDNLTLRDHQHFDASRMIGSKQLTDIFLLGLAVHNEGKLITLDRNIPLQAVRKATAENIEVII